MSRDVSDPFHFFRSCGCLILSPVVRSESDLTKKQTRRIGAELGYSVEEKVSHVI